MESTRKYKIKNFSEEAEIMDDTDLLAKDHHAALRDLSKINALTFSAPLFLHHLPRHESVAFLSEIKKRCNKILRAPACQQAGSEGFKILRAFGPQDDGLKFVLSKV